MPFKPTIPQATMMRRYVSHEGNVLNGLKKLRFIFKFEGFRDWGQDTLVTKRT
jgi:hypothetical protein